MSGQVTKEDCDRVRAAALKCLNTYSRAWVSLNRIPFEIRHDCADWLQDIIAEVQPKAKKAFDEFDAVWRSDVADWFILNRPDRSARYGPLRYLTATEMAFRSCTTLTALDPTEAVFYLKLTGLLKLLKPWLAPRPEVHDEWCAVVKAITGAKLSADIPKISRGHHASHASQRKVIDVTTQDLIHALKSGVVDGKTVEEINREFFENRQFIDEKAAEAAKRNARRNREKWDPENRAQSR